MADIRQGDLPIQPVEEPILCGPYGEPDQHWVYDTETGAASKMPGRRPASYWWKDRRTSGPRAVLQLPGMAEERRDPLPLVNALREDVKRWRGADLSYEGATHVTRELLRHWWRDDRRRRLFFCQLEAVETIIYLNEIRGRRRDDTRGRPRFNPVFTDADFLSLVDQPLDKSLGALTRYGCKMATGSGKTVVMAMVIAWAFCNRGKVTSDERFPRAVLVCCPNLTVKERLQVLRPDNPANYYNAFDIVPVHLRPLMQSGHVMVTNWHALAMEGEHVESGKSYGVVNKGAESDDAFSRRVLGDLYDHAPIMVLNDEAHHAYRPKAVDESESGRRRTVLTAEQKAAREEATVWIAGLDRLNASCGIRFCVDLSATPFYLAGSGYVEGSPFPWLVSDFGLVDAIESGIVKIPRLPVSDTTGRPDPKYFQLYRTIVDGLQPIEKTGYRPKPEVMWREAEGALRTLAGQYKERFDQIEASSPGQVRTPPVLILVCENTDMAQCFFEHISGESTVDDVIPEDADEDEGSEAEEGPKRKAKNRTVYGTGMVFPELYSNTAAAKRTVRIDSKLLAEAESEDPKSTRKTAGEQLRQVIATVGKPGEPGEQVRCVVSVSMLTEGWDASNVTHILGLRPFESQLLCEQVVGRGLRRMDYAVDPSTGLLTAEYVDIYGIPFSIIPYKGRPTGAAPPDDRPLNHVFAMEERAGFEIRYPVVESYAFALKRNVIRADIARMQTLAVEPNKEPTAVFVKPKVGYQDGHPTPVGPGEALLQDRRLYYESTHLQAIEFEIARRVVTSLTDVAVAGNGKLKLYARHQLFPQVLRLVHDYVRTKVDVRGEHRCELGLSKYVDRLVERLVEAIEPDEQAGEPPLIPVLNRYRPSGSSQMVNFKTKRPCHGTMKSHINQVVVDTATWESSAAFRLEQSGHVECYARNEQMGFVIPYDFQGVTHSYEPDFIVRLKGGRLLIVEVKGYEDEQDRAKHQAAQRWVSAVNRAGNLGTWRFFVCKDPQMLERQVEYFAREEW